MHICRKMIFDIILFSLLKTPEIIIAHNLLYNQFSCRRLQVENEHYSVYNWLNLISSSTAILNSSVYYIYLVCECIFIYIYMYMNIQWNLSIKDL